MSDREMWPNEGDNTRQWAEAPTSPSPVDGGDETAPGPDDPTKGPGPAPIWPAAVPEPTPAYGQHGQQPYGQTPYGQHGQAPYGQPPYGGHGQPPYDQPRYGQRPSGPSPYDQPPYGQHQAGQHQLGQHQAGQQQPGQYQAGQHQAGQPTFGPYGPPPYRPYGEQATSRPLPSHRRARVLQSTAAVLVIAAAAVAGGGVSHVIWPSAVPANAAAPTTTDPGSSGTVPGSSGGSSGVSPFGTVPSGTGGSGTTSEGAGAPADVSAIAAKVDPALVDINSTFNYQGAEGAGTGIVLTSNGEILTNNHVIDGATKISVTDIGNGKTYSGTVVGYDDTKDVAVVQLQGASGLTTAKLATSPPAVGEAVVAIGNAGGTGGTPTSAGGSITALDQSITASDELTGTDEDLTGLIEVNANIEAGDSGGSLVNAAGQVVGMDTAASDESFAFSSQGNQGFAIPMSTATTIARDILSDNGTSTVHVGPTAFIGVYVEPSSSAIQSPYSGLTTPSVSGASIQSAIAGGPAQKVGIGPGDTITSLGGHSITSGTQLTQALVAYHPGQKVTVGWVTSTGQSERATLTLGSGPPA
jgi:S1-C subfamily serine protease